MRKFLKVISLIAGICLIAGVIMLAVAAPYHESISSYHTGETILLEQSLTDSYGINKISIDIDIADVTLIYEGSEPRLDGAVNEYQEYSLYRSGDTLIISLRDNSEKWYNNIHFFPIYNYNYNYNSVTITLPEDWKYKNLDYEINISLGSIECERLDADTLDISVSAGSISVNNVNAENLYASCDLGNIYLQGSVYDTCYLRCDAGAIEASFDNSPAPMSSLSAIVGVGEINVDNFNVDSVNAECSAGMIKLSGTIGQKCALSCDIGDIELTLNDSESNWQTEVTDMGIGSLRYDGRDYSGIGGSYLSRTDGDKLMTISLSMGEIDVTFKSYNGRK